MKTLFFLDLSFNLIENFFDRSFEGLNRLRKLKLQNNKLTKLPKPLFEKLYKIKEVDLSYNLFKKVPYKTLQEITNLEELKLSGNTIDHISKRDLLKFTKLETLKIDNLNLGEIEEGAFDTLEELRFLNVTSNLLMTLPVPSNSGELIKIDLDQNEFVCDCELFDFYMFMRMNTKITG